MKEDQSKLWVSLGGSLLTFLMSLFVVWNNLTNQFAEVKTELRFVSQQLSSIKILIDAHIVLPAHPVAEQVTKALSKDLLLLEERFTKIEAKMK